MKVINDKLMTLPEYKKRLADVAKDSSNFSGIQGSITGKAFLDALQWTSVFSMRFDTSSSPNLPSTNTQKWMNFIEGYSNSTFPVISDGKNSVI